MNEFLLDNLSVDTQKAHDCVEKIISKELVEIARSFEDNIDGIFSILVLPASLMIYSARDKLRYKALNQVILRNLARIRNQGFMSQEDAVRWITTQVDFEYKSDEEAESKEAVSYLEHLAKHDRRVRVALEALLYNAVTSAWTTVEIVAKDTWTTVVDARPFQLAQRVLQASPDNVTEGWSSKNITFGLLAKYGFDVRSSLGKILAPRFDFTGVKGIRTAYIAAFNKTKELEQIFANSTIKDLEATRHLIVHRGGVADDTFRKRTNSSVAAGEKMVIDAKTASELINAAIGVCCGILELADTWLEANPSSE